jgi:hypothetical protein
VGAKAKANAQDRWVQYAACLRDHGVDGVEAVAGAQGGVRIGSPNSTAAERAAIEAKVKIADRSCGRILHPQQSTVSAAEEARFRDGMAAFARCMRDHGVEMPDPKIVRVSGGFDVSFPAAAGGVPPELTKAWRAAQPACQRLNPLLAPPK